ncbi:MAG: DUF2807 domain-containing protein [Bacteroidota bacterium]|nr:DUF2807 domain-containing protein [Bacteroidota bacterium]
MKIGLFYLAMLALLLSSCVDMGERIKGNGNIKSENRTVGKAEKIKVAGDMDVYIDQGPTSVKVEGDENILRYIETLSNDEWFEIRTKDNVNISTEKPVKVYVTTPNITDLKITGSGNITCNQKFSTDNNTSFNITGSGDIITAINAPKVEAHISGSGNLHISGETKNVEIHISGSGNYDGPDLKAENADVSIAGSGDAELFADNKLKASVAGSGNVKYKGNATVDSHIAGSGSVTKAQ